MELLAWFLTGNAQKNVWWRLLTVVTQAIGLLALGVVLTHYSGVLMLFLLWHAIPLLADSFPFLEQIFLIHFVAQPALLLVAKFRSHHSKNVITEMSSILQVLFPGAIAVLCEMYWMFGMMTEEVYLRHANLPVPEWELSLFFFAGVSTLTTLFYLALLEDAHAQPYPNPNPS